MLLTGSPDNALRTCRFVAFPRERDDQEIHMTMARSYSVAARIAVLALALTTLTAADALAQKKKATTFNVLPINITSVTPVNGQLVASGTVGSTLFQAPLILTPQALAPGAACPVLDLSLGPINLSLLG